MIASALRSRSLIIIMMAISPIMIAIGYNVFCGTVEMVMITPIGRSPTTGVQIDSLNAMFPGGRRVA